MSEDDWRAGFAKSLGVFLNGRAIPTPDERGERIYDESFYVMLNAGHEPVRFSLPDAKWGTRWRVLINTYEAEDHMSEEDGGAEFDADARMEVQPWTLVLLQRTAWRAKPAGSEADVSSSETVPHAGAGAAAAALPPR
jgi:glycogen operon protein